MAELQERLSHLEEQVKQNSQNSSRPPSSEGFGQKSKPAKEKNRRSRGGQPGHDGHRRDLYPLESCQAHFDHHPPVCGQCGHPLEGNDPAPDRHPIVDLPPIEPIVTEHRLRMSWNAPIVGRKLARSSPQKCRHRDTVSA